MLSELCRTIGFQFDLGVLQVKVVLGISEETGRIVDLFHVVEENERAVLCSSFTRVLVAVSFIILMWEVSLFWGRKSLVSSTILASKVCMRLYALLSIKPTKWTHVRFIVGEVVKPIRRRCTSGEQES